MTAGMRRRLRISTQQGVILRALRLHGQRHPASRGCNCAALYLALYGRKPEYLGNYLNYASLCRSLDRLAQRGLIQKYRAPYYQVTRTGSASGLKRPVFRITAEGAAYLERCPSEGNPHRVFCELVALDPKDHAARTALLRSCVVGYHNAIMC